MVQKNLGGQISVRDFVYIACLVGLLATLDGLGYTQLGGPVCSLREAIFDPNSCVAPEPHPGGLPNVPPQYQRSHDIV